MCSSDLDLFAFGGGCTFATAACATKFGKTPGAISMSQGFQVFNTPPTPATFTGTIQAQNLNFKLGRVQQFNVNVERQLPGEIVLTVGYAGSRSSHILVDGNNINLGTPSACGTPGYTRGCAPGGGALLPPYQAFCSPFGCSTILESTDQGAAHYNSLQIKAETKSSKYGLYALVGYTYSRTYDSGFADGLGSNYGATYFPLPGWQKLDWALSGINLNNNFTASVIYDLPVGKGKKFGSGWSGPANTILGNWQVTVIEKITSGFPVFIVDSNNASGSGFLNNNGASLTRPDLVAGCNPSAAPKTPTEWFNTACFVHAAAGTLGTASRAPVSGPGFVNTDFSLIKQFALPWENMGLNFRAEVFNLFNHPQFASPDSTGSLGIPDVNAPGFGSIASTVNNPRLVQFGLKLTF